MLSQMFTLEVAWPAHISTGSDNLDSTEIKFWNILVIDYHFFFANAGAFANDQSAFLFFVM